VISWIIRLGVGATQSATQRPYWVISATQYLNHFLKIFKELFFRACQFGRRIAGARFRLFLPSGSQNPDAFGMPQQRQQHLSFD